MYGGYDGSATQFAGNGWLHGHPDRRHRRGDRRGRRGESLFPPALVAPPCVAIERCRARNPDGSAPTLERGVFAPGHPPRFVQIFPFPGSILTFSHPLRLSFPQRGQGRPDSLVPVTVKMLQTAIAASNVVRSRTDSSPHASIDAPLPISDPTRDFKPAQLCF